MWNGLPLLIFGTSGISKEVKTVVDEINSRNIENQYNFLGYIGEKKESVGELINGAQIVTCDETLEEYISQFKVVGVVIPLGTPKIKQKIYEKVKKYTNVVFPNIISPSAKLMDPENIKFGKGNIVTSGVIITTNVTIGDFNLFNLNTTVGHNVIIEDYCVINPLVAVSGDCTIKTASLLGAGVSVKQGIQVGENSVIGLGGFVVKDVEDNKIMVCKAAKELVR